MPDSNKSEALRRMAGGIAHELNNICTAISGNLQLIEDQDPPRDIVLEIVADVLRTTRQGIALARRLQAYGGYQALQPEPFDLAAMIRAISKEPFLQGRIVKLDLPEKTCPVVFDKSRMQEMITEIALNARTATAAGGVITFGLRASPGGPGVELHICDTGLGMSQDEIENAFDPLFTTKPLARASTGWGLSLAWGLVRQMGGEITLSPRKGGGTHVAIRLPAHTIRRL